LSPLRLPIPPPGLESRSNCIAGLGRALGRCLTPNRLLVSDTRVVDTGVVELPAGNWPLLFRERSVRLYANSNLRLNNL